MKSNPDRKSDRKNGDWVWKLTDKTSHAENPSQDCQCPLTNQTSSGQLRNSLCVFVTLILNIKIKFHTIWSTIYGLKDIHFAIDDLNDMIQIIFICYIHNCFSISQTLQSSKQIKQTDYSSKLFSR